MDAFTKFTWIYFLKHKSETTHTFKLYESFVKLYASFVQNQIHTTIKVGKSDYGDKFRPFTKYLTELASHTCSLSLTHLLKMAQWKGNTHTHIVEIGPIMLSHAYMPL